MDWWRKDTFTLSGALEAGEVTPVTLLEHFQERVDRLNGKVNAVVHVNADAERMAAASTKRRKSGRALGPLDGVPMLLKDNLVAKGMPATWGSRLYANRIRDRDEVPVERLRRAGAVFLGKTNVPEFTVEGFTANEIFGVTRNPWDTCKIPGGSSGGSVAAIALGMASYSIGTDGGGSVRRPASYANLVGLKTSIGRIPRGDGLPQLLLDMETIGPITRSVRDQALILNALAGPDRHDHRSRNIAMVDFVKEIDLEPSQLRVLAVEQIDDAPVDPEIRHSFRHSVELMSKLGHDVRIGSLPFDVQPVYEHWTSIANIGLSLLLQREPEMEKRASKKYVEWAQKSYSATHLLYVFEVLGKIRNDVSRAFEKVDIIMTPSSAAMPWPTDLDFPSEIDGLPVGPRGSAVFSGWVNACGHPGISIPSKRGASGLPIGLQFVSDFCEDGLLLRLARQVEKVADWRGDWPQLANEDVRS